MNLPYSLVAGANGTANITVFVNGEVYTADNEHANFDAIVDAVRAGDESAVDLFDVAKAAKARFDSLTERLSERVLVSNGHIFFDGTEVNNTLTEQVIRFINEGQDFAPLVRFWEKLATNPNEHSREHLYRWLQTEKFTITDDGDILGYKYLNADFGSNHAGPGIVNGVAANGHLDNSVGNIVEMDRSKVTFDPQRGCSVGLHVGTWGYVAGSNTVVEVIVNPRDVVSVPTDCSDQKMRVCRYTVHAVAKGKTDAAVKTVTPSGGSVDTRDNHKSQTRDSRGRFLSKV